MANKPKLLSPAGSMQALKSAISSGADEVYLGGSDFNARINATNFDRNALIKAGEICRNANVSLNITLNTLIYDKEFKSVLEYVSFLADKVMPDSLIIQDLGLAVTLRREFPQLALHASTQMRIHSYLDAEYLKSLGFTRAVLARELPKEDIASFVKTGLETEIFVHGAICVSESGGCLMSSVIGSRSGNRGECAQPCRLPYRHENKYPLSLKDMCLASHIKEISDIGVTALKIEGRMKSPEYVGAVTSVYRKLIDENRNATGEEIKYLANIFSRSGFTDGYFVSKIDKSMFGIRREDDKRITEKTSFRPIAVKKRDERDTITVPTECIIPERDEEKTLHPSKQKGFVLRFEGNLPSDEFFAKYAPTASRIDVPLEMCADKRVVKYAETVSAIMPRNIFVSELDKVKKQLENVKKSGIKNATISSLNHITLCENMYLHGDYAFNVINRETVDFLENYSFSSVMLSPETDGKFVRFSKCALEYIGYGRTPLMHTRTCIIKNLVACKNREKCMSMLTDRTGARFPIISRSNHTNTIYNSLPAYRLDRKSELKKCGVGLLTLMFTDESEKQMEEVINLYLSGEKPKFEYTRR
ncbi:MAG: U32 family peptidase [Clostridia bacterium]|nr:U32 family peptidase [Clostridia bacterium]